MMELFTDIIEANQEGTLVFIHGNSSSTKVFDTAQAKIKRSKILIDLPGHGQSPRAHTNPSIYQIASLREIIKDYLNSIETPFLLVGNSLGGHLAIEVAPEVDRCKGIVIFGTPPLDKPLNMEEAFLPTDVLKVYLKSDYTKQELDYTMEQITNNTSARPLLANDFEETDPAFREQFVHSALELNQLLNEKEIVANLAIPTYCIHGLQDPSVSLSYLRSLKGIKRIYEIDDCGHYPSLEQPAQFAKIINEIADEVFDDFELS